MIRKKMTRFFRIFLLAALVVPIVSTVGYAATYYVATNGSDSNPGSLTAPFRTVQRSLDLLQAGDTCLVRGGTYNETLTLKRSGTSSAPITIRNYLSETATINSGTSKALVTGGRIHYYTIDGLRFISTFSSNNDYTLSFNNGIWDGDNNPEGGNNGFIIINCYIEGSILLYGHYNRVESCEINGKSSWTNGIREQFGSSHHNVYRNNTVYAFKERGIWSMQYTNYVLIEGNTIHDSQNMGIDIDGAAHPCYNATVRGNTIYKVAGRGIEMENAFNSIVENNVIHDSQLWGISILNYGFGPDYTSDKEYRTTNTNSIFRNNLIYNTAQAGIILFGSPGNKIYNNTIFGNKSTPGYFGAIAVRNYYQTNYPSSNTTIKNNLFADNTGYSIWIDGNPTNLQMSNNLYYNSNGNINTHYWQGVGTYTLAKFKTDYGQESGSSFANPLFRNATVFDFHIQSTSPAKDAGTTVSDVISDIEGISRPQGSAYDIGAYEYSTTPASSALPPPSNLRII